MTRAPNPFLVVALLVSILVHLFLVDRAVDLTLKWRLFSTTSGDELFRVQDIRVEPTPAPPLGRPKWRPEDLISLGVPKEEAKVAQETEDKGVLLKTEKFISSEAPEEKLLEAIQKAIDAEEVTRADETPPAPASEGAIAQEVIAIDEAMIKEQIPPSRPRISAKVRRGTATSDFIFFSENGPSAEPVPRAITQGPPGESLAPAKAAERKRMAAAAMAEEARIIPGVIAPPPPIVEREIESADVVDIVTDEYEKIKKYPPLDDLLAVRLFTYHRPGERRGYFELVVEPRRDKKDFRVIPKDIIFVVDSSKSITQGKLERYVEGLKLCLRTLSPRDRFNIVEFKSFMRRLVSGRDVVPVTPELIAQGEAFLSGLVSEGATDVYACLMELVRSGPTPGRPRIIFLVTDGRPQAEVTQDRVIINQVTTLNNLRTSIFSFAGGAKINTFLLDLISYRNRGARMFEENDRRIPDSLFRFYQAVSSPILLNPRFNFGSLDSTEVYPKVLPDLYLNSRLEMLGRFESERQFSMQLLGEADGQTREYVLQQELTGKDNGDQTTAQRWAFRKIYYLVGQMVQEGESQAMLSSIRMLSSAYNVQTSYYR